MTHDITAQELTRDNAAILFVDHQEKLVAGSRIPDPETLARNSVGLAQSARILGIPVIATTTLKPLFGPFFAELTDVIGNDNIIERSLIDPFEDERVAKAIEATGRTHLIVAGVAISVCAYIPATSALARGLRAYVAVDASASLDQLEFQTTLHRLTQAGVVVANYGALMVEILADNADPIALDVYQAMRTQYSVSTLAALGANAA